MNTKIKGVILIFTLLDFSFCYDICWIVLVYIWFFDIAKVAWLQTKCPVHCQTLNNLTLQKLILVSFVGDSGFPGLPGVRGPAGDAGLPGLPGLKGYYWYWNKQIQSK